MYERQIDHDTRESDNGSEPKKNKMWWVDFECWSVEAKSADEAEAKVIELLKTTAPKVSNIESQD